MAGKTGTSQVTIGKIKLDLENNAWFVGFCEDEDHPYAFVVYLEGGGAGSGMALQVASYLLGSALELGY